MLKTITPNDIAKSKDNAEYLYRKARLAHKTGDLTNAKLWYQQTIEATGDQPWYFAPNAALQLGYIAQSQGDVAGAKRHFEKTLSYPNYEYKNGIDAKAKSALDQLKK